MFRLYVEAEIRPTEDPQRVLTATRNLVPEENAKAEVVAAQRIVKIESDNVASLRRLHFLLRKERILDAARKSLLGGIGANRLEFNLNKQAAYAGRVSFSSSTGESPLGPIRFLIEYESPMSLIDWLAPKTVRGRPIREMPEPVLN